MTLLTVLGAGACCWLGYSLRWGIDAWQRRQEAVVGLCGWCHKSVRRDRDYAEIRTRDVTPRGAAYTVTRPYHQRCVPLVTAVRDALSGNDEDAPCD